jgi:glycosyltransferase involved in cell wall biosynthesis
MKVVVVDKFPPFPANDGGKLRSAAILRRLAARGEVVLCAFEQGGFDNTGFADLGIDVRTVPWDPTAWRTARGLARTGTASAGRFWDGRLAAVVREATASAPADVLLVEHGQLACYLDVGRARLKVLDLHNIDSALAASYARSAKTPGARLAAAEAVLLRRLERRAVSRADVVVTVSEDDARRLPPAAGEVLRCPNGWETRPVLPPAVDPVVVFAATLGWRPNVDAAIWFGREVWPRVIERSPAARLLLVGKDPAEAVRALACGTIEVTGTVPDMRPYLARARVAVAPLLAGGGTRLKILEALDAGRAVVSTVVGVEGLHQLIGHGVEVADDAASMAASVSSLLADPGRASALGTRGHDAVARHFSWDAVLAPLLARIDVVAS